MRKLLVSLLAFTALTGAATAADLPTQKEPPVVVVPSFIWTGFYGGVQLGGAFGQTAFSIPAYRYQKDWGNSGVFGGGHVGYNYQIQSLVLGAEAEFNAQSNKGSISDAVRFAPQIFNGSNA